MHKDTKLKLTVAFSMLIIKTACSMQNSVVVCLYLAHTYRTQSREEHRILTEESSLGEWCLSCGCILMGLLWSFQLHAKKETPLINYVDKDVYKTPHSHNKHYILLGYDTLQLDTETLMFW